MAKITDPVQNVSEEEAVILGQLGISEVKPMAPSRFGRFVHYVMGCRPLPHYVLDTKMGRVVEMGRICPICLMEFPSDT